MDSVGVSQVRRRFLGYSLVTPRTPVTDYDDVADAFIASRSSTIGVAAVRAWARALPEGGRVLDVGCGHGIPIARILAEAGLTVHGVDTSPRLLEAFRENVPGATAELADAATLEVESGGFDGVVLWGLLFLLTPAAQEALITGPPRR